MTRTKAAIRKMPSSLDKFYKSNEHFDVLNANLMDDATLKSIKLHTHKESATLQELRTWQRLLRIHPDKQAAMVLYENNIHSAQQLVKVSRSKFVKNHKEKLGEETAVLVYDKAKQIHNQVMHLLGNVYSTVSRQSKNLRVNHLSAVTDYFETLTDYQKIFGSLNYCSCDECKSMLGPAAYFVDLMRVIDKAITVPYEKKIPVGLSLKDRRPDLWQIELNCENTKAMVPYLQIVNEILENTVLNALKAEDPDSNPVAWLYMAQAVFPFNTPYNLPLSQIRLLLSQFNQNLSKVIETFDPISEPALGRSIEKLNLSWEQYKLVTTVDTTAAGLSKAFGVTVGSNDNGGLNRLDTMLRQTSLTRSEFISLIRQQLSDMELSSMKYEYSTTIFVSDYNTKLVMLIDDGGNVIGFFNDHYGRLQGVKVNNVITGTWSQANEDPADSAGKFEFTMAADMSTFEGKWMRGYNGVWETALWKGKLDVSAEKITMADGFFINGKQAVNNFLRIIVNETDPLNPFEEITNLDHDALDRLNRFIRLAAAIGWDYPTLDWVITSLEATEIDDKLLISLAEVKQLSEKYAVTPVTLTACWFDLKTRGTGNGTNSLAPFDTVFNNSVLIRNGLNLDYYHPYTEVTGDNATDGSFDNPVYLSPPVNWTADTGTSGKEMLTATDPAMQTYARRILSGIGASTNDLVLVAKHFLKSFPVVSLDVPNLSLLNRHCFLARQMGLPVTEYLELLKLMEKGNCDYIGLEDVRDLSSVNEWMKETGLNVYELDYILHGNTSLYVNIGYTDSTLKDFLQTLLLSLTQHLVVSESFISNDISPDVSVAFYNYFQNAANGFLNTKGIVLKILTDDDKKKITGLTLPDGTKIVPTAGQLDFAQQQLNTSYMAQQQVVTGSLSSFFSSTTSIVSAICAGVSKILNIPSLPDIFLADNGKIDQTVKGFTVLFSQHLMLTGELKLTSAQLENIYNYSEAYTEDGKNAIDFNKLSLNNIQSIWKMTRLVEIFQDTKDEFINYLALASDGTVSDDDLLRLCKLTGWNKEQCVFVCDLLFGKDNRCKTVSQIYEVNSCFQISQATGLDVYGLKSVADLKLLPATTDNWKIFNNQADVLTGALKAKFVDAAWPPVYEQFNSPQLEQQRNVLEAFCVWKLSLKYNDITTPRDLYEFLLIDVEMSGIAKTSYIRQALNTAQLYLQRCRLNLERDIKVSSSDIHETWWSWLLNYSVWQTNREVFLYPENFLQPGLRNNKTSIFQQLEDDLSQNDVTKKSADQLFRQYLDRFTQFIDLQYVDACKYTVNDPQLGPVSTEFFFAKTKASPAQYYYITRKQGAIWSNWQSIDISINADTITSVYAFGRLFVFWVEVKKERVMDINTTDWNKQLAASKLSVYYSYIDYNGNWVQQQTLVKDRTFDVDTTNNDYYKPLVPEAFDDSHAYWHKLIAVPVSEGNFNVKDNERLSGEKLAIFIGSLLTMSANNPYNLPGKPNINTISNGGAVAEFLWSNYNSSQDYEHGYKIRKFGQIPIENAIILDETLNHSQIFSYNDTAFLENDYQTMPPFRAAFDQAGGRLILIGGINTISTNYSQGLNLDRTAALLPALAEDSSFQNSELDISQQKSAEFFTALKNNGIIDSNKKVRSDIKLYSVAKINEYIKTSNVNAQYVWNKLCQICYGSPILLAAPLPPGDSLLPVRNSTSSFIFVHSTGTFLIESPGLPTVEDLLLVQPGFSWVERDTSFTNQSLGIDDNMSRNIYGKFRELGILDSNGTNANVDSHQWTADTLIELLEKKSVVINQPQADWILTILQGNGVTSLRCIDSSTNSLDKNFYTLSFKTTQLSSGSGQELSNRMFKSGVEGVLQLSTQSAPVNVTTCFNDFKPNTSMMTPPAIEFDYQVDFSGPFGNYFWELFYYAPMLVADRLRANKQFADAEKWYQYIFNPTIPPFSVDADYFINKDFDKTKAQGFYDAFVSQAFIANGQVTEKGNMTKPADLISLGITGDYRWACELCNMLHNAYLVNQLSRYWQFKPFRNQTIDKLVADLGNKDQIAAYNDDPLNPNAIARLRIGAFEKNAVMKYIDNLLDWGDMEFSQYTWESITTATMLYAYANDLLGPRPEDLGACSGDYEMNFAQIQAEYGADIPQFLIGLEQILNSLPELIVGDPGIGYNDLDTYFCVPDNKYFMGYWDRVEDRLYKIRHCLNIDGKPQQLPLYDSPAPFGELIKAGNASNSVLIAQSPMTPAVPYYRFTASLARAYNITNTVTQLGSALLAALEKNDAEAMALLTSSQQIVLLDMMTRMKQQQVEIQQATIASAISSLASAQYRLDHYAGLLNQKLNGLEIAGLVLMGASIYPQVVSAALRGISIAGYLIPDTFGFSFGGMDYGSAINAGAMVSDSVAAMLNQSASVMSTVAQYERRAEEWTLQQKIADYDVQQLTQQLTAAQQQLLYNEQDLAVHLRTIEQTKRVEDFLKSKFTSQQLYQWMIGRLSSLYSDTYQLAISAALSAQAAYQYELNSEEKFINYNYWDSLRKGLLSGEGLNLSLQQMEQSYVNNNRRLLEIQKTVSLRQVFPKEFFSFIWGPDKDKQGVLNFSLSERLFDFDFPGHYCRKIKSISVTIPAVVGPYQNLHATLTQNSNAILLKADPKDMSPVQYLLYVSSLPHGGTPPPKPPSSVLRENWMPNQQIAVSQGIGDDGLFQLDFNDDRYLPFEGTGVVSSWTFKLPPDTNPINFESISDVIINISYTAMDGGQDYANKVKSIYSGTDVQYKNLLAKSMEMNQTYAPAWFKMFVTPPVNNQQILAFKVTDEYVLTTLRNIRLHSVLIQIEVDDSKKVSDKTAAFIKLKIGQGTEQDITVKDNFGELPLNGLGAPIDSNWSFIFDINNAPVELLNDDPNNKALDPKKFLNMAVVIVYEANVF